MKILAIIESLTGNTVSFLDYLKEEYKETVFVDVIHPRDGLGNKAFKDYDKVIIGCYTWDSGRIPIKTKKFVIKHREELLNSDVLIYGTGWSMYQNFCGAVNGLSIILDHKFPTIKYELRFDKDLEVEAIETLKNFIIGDDF